MTILLAPTRMDGRQMQPRVEERAGMAPFEGEPTDEHVRAAMVILWDHLVKDLLAEIDRPHAIMASDPQAGGGTYLIGPFPDGFSALVAADKAMSDEGLNAGFCSYRVVPLEAP